MVQVAGLEFLEIPRYTASNTQYSPSLDEITGYDYLSVAKTIWENYDLRDDNSDAMFEVDLRLASSLSCVQVLLAELCIALGHQQLQLLLPAKLKLRF